MGTMTPAEFCALRDQLGVTQVELARMLGVTSISVSRYETGARPISSTVAILLRLLAEIRHTDAPTDIKIVMTSST